MPTKRKLAVLLIKDKQIIISHFYLINIHIFDYPDSRLSGLFTEVPMSPDNRGSTVLKRNRISQHGALARSELIGFAILVNTVDTVVMSFTLVYYLLTIIPIFHFMDSLTNKIVTPTD